MFKLGDLVIVSFSEYAGGEDKIGIFIEDDTRAIGYCEEGYPIITRARVLWDGEIYSTPLDQIYPVESPTP